ncbi:MAG: diacylglycerol kinase [uncultured bacterium]|nr:MAG: diacylglycerol kinase [uncultured bacterium]
MSRKYTVFGSFGFALAGIREAFFNEPNFRIHSIAAILAYAGGVIFSFTFFEFALLTFAIIMVLVLELLNTSLEKITDLVSPDIHPKAKVAKDVSSAAVFLGSIGSVIIGLLLFLPKILSLFLK